MKKILNFLNPNIPPDNLRNANEITIWREKILQIVLLAAAGIALLAFLTGFITGILNQDNRALLSIFTFATIFIVSLSLFRFLPYRFRAQVLPLLTLGISVFSITQVGLSVNGSIFLLSTAILATILLGLSTGIFYLVAELLLISVYAGLVLVDVIQYPAGNVLSDPYQPVTWIMWAIFTLLLSLIIVVSINQLLGGLSSTLNQQRHLTLTIESERTKLAFEVEKQTRDLQRRLDQLRTVAEISAEISKTLDEKELLQKVVDLVCDSFGLYYAGVFLIDELGEYAVLRAGTGEEGRQMVSNQHRLAVNGPSMIGWATGRKEPRIALDVGAEAVHFNNPYLPNTRSEMALPIIGKNNRVLGAMTIQSARHRAFDENDILILQNVTNSLAVALENADLFRQSQESLHEIATLNRAYVQQAWSETIDHMGELLFSFDNRPTRTSAENLEKINVPLLIRDQKIGEFEIEMNLDSLSEEDASFIESISSQTALALENARLLEQSQRQTIQEKKINQLSADFARASDVEQILKTAIQEISNLPDITEVAIHLNTDNGIENNNGRELNQ